ncbi:MAG TPA: hypothetical protein VM681_00930 [Candidatus Thermoplasmatota archaeon]|nr:hypothetical protein [Candidatus Thermoplasmatota archaeon]
MRFLALLAAVGLLSGCLGGSNPLDRTGGGMRVELDVAIMESYPEQFLFQARAENGGTSAFVYDHPGCPAESIRIFVVVRGEERPIDRALFGPCVINERRFEPRQSVEENVPWDGTLDGERVPSGTYTAIARLNVAGGAPRIEDRETFTVP